MGSETRNYCIKIRGGNSSPSVLSDRELFINQGTHALYYGPSGGGSPKLVIPPYSTTAKKIVNELNGDVYAEPNTRQGLNVVFSADSKVTNGTFDRLNVERIVPTSVYSSLEEANRNLSRMIPGQLVFIKI